MRALVTGGTGFIGSHLVEYLLERGDEVTCLARNRSRLRWLDHSKVRLVEGDCTDPNLGGRLPVDLDWVFHLAGITKTLEWDEYYRVNGKGTGNLGAALAERGQPPRLVYLSSLAAAGPSADGHPLREPEPPRPVSHHGRSKLEGEKALKELGTSLPWVIVRAPVIYGPRDRDLLPFFQLAKRRVAFRLGGRRVFSLCYVEDLVRSLYLAAERGRDGEIYYIAEACPRSWDEIWHAIASALGVRPVTIPFPPVLLAAAAWMWEGVARLTGIPPLLNRDKACEMRQQHWVCDPGKAAQELGFTTSIPLRTGAQRAVDWYHRYRWL
ncbi:MAG: NAD-dependent epimerase/dehydratase family protein [Candidatus Methylomirabilales bacterium]